MFHFKLITNTQKRRLDTHSRIYVVGNGKRTGYEHLVAYDAKVGKVLSRTTSNHPNQVAIPDRTVKRALDKRGRVVVHHNHPGGTSLSREDIHNLGRLPGTLEVHAHGHDKQWYLASSRRERRFTQMLLEADAAFDRCLWEMGYGNVPQELHNHLFNLGFSHAGAIYYEHRLDPQLEQLYCLVSENVRDALIQAVVQAAHKERSRK